MISFPALTDREREVAALMVDGKTGREVARALGISIRTCEVHRGRIFKKIGVRNAVELARVAIREGWVPVEWPLAQTPAPQAITVAHVAITLPAVVRH